MDSAFWWTKMSELGLVPTKCTTIYCRLGDTAHLVKDTAIGRTSNSAMASQGIMGNKQTQQAIGKYGVNFHNEDDLDIDRDIFADQGDCCGEDTCFGWLFPFCSRNNMWYESVVAPTSVQKIEPKTFFANERTFLHWLHHGIILASVASGILAFSSETGEEWGTLVRSHAVATCVRILYLCPAHFLVACRQNQDADSWSLG
jgi:hypothetical protein